MHALALARSRVSNWYHLVGKFRSGLAFGKQLPAAQLPQVPQQATGVLETYFDEHLTGPGLWKLRHYFPIYERHLAKFVGREVHVVEIGVHSGGSLRMWKSYFGDDVHLYGIDLRPEIHVYEDANTRVFVGDQSDPEFWKRFLDEVPEVDVIIDDGGHMAHQQIVTLEALLPHLRPGGVYLCEDVMSEMHAFHGYVDGLARNLHTKAPLDADEHHRATTFQRAVDSIHNYPYVVVIEKRIEAIEFLDAEKHGTEWQPFGHKHLDS